MRKNKPFGDQQPGMARATLDRRRFLAGLGAASLGVTAKAGMASNESGQNLSAATPSGGTRLLKNAFIYTADTDNRVYPDGWVLVDGDRIAAVGDASVPTPEADETIDCSGRMLLPGFANPHWHECFVEGPDPLLPDDSDLTQLPFSKGGNIEALGSYFGAIADIAEQLRPEEAIAIARWSLFTQLRSGTTAIGDTGSLNSADAMAEAAIDLGMRIRVSRWGSDIKIPNGSDQYVRIADWEKQARDWESILQKWHAHPSGLVDAMPSVLASFGSSDEQLAALREVADRYAVPYSVHLAPLKNERAAVSAVFGKSPVERIAEHGLLTDRLISIHTAYASESEYLAIVDADVKVCHSPANYGNLGEATVSETRQIGRFLKDGVKVSLSTDGNIEYMGGIPEAMRYAHLGHNEANNDNTFCPPTTALAMGTRNAAAALGWADSLGSIEAGKQADLVLVPIDDWRFRMNRHPLRTFLVAGGSNDVESVMVAGRFVIRDGRSTMLDEEAVYREFEKHVRAAKRRLFG